MAESDKNESTPESGDSSQQELDNYAQSVMSSVPFGDLYTAMEGLDLAAQIDKDNS